MHAMIHSQAVQYGNRWGKSQHTFPPLCSLFVRARGYKRLNRWGGRKALKTVPSLSCPQGRARSQVHSQATRS